MTTPAVIWDMGGIIYRYFTELMLEEGVDRGWPLDRLPLGPTGRVLDVDYQRMLDGEIDEPDYVAVVVDRLAAEGIEFDPPRDLRWDGHLRPETIATIDLLAGAAHLQAVLTNDASRWLGDGWWTTWEHADRFRAMIDVKTLGVRKPAPEPYLAVAAELRIDPSECLFVDDLPVNCRGAEAVGMQSHLFDITRPTDSLSSLERRLGVGPL